MESVEAEGRSVSEATQKALTELGLTRDQVEIEVLSEGRPRLLGFGGEPARVKATPRAAAPVPAAVRQQTEPVLEDEDDDLEIEELDSEEEIPPPPPPSRPRPENAPQPIDADPAEVEAAAQVLENLIRLMGVEATVAAREPETPGDGVGMNEAVLDIEGEDLGILIGRRGQTLMSLQYILNLILSKRTNRRVAFGVDVDGYRQRREEALVGLAQRSAERVRGTGKSVTLEPMPANERRIVHITLAEDATVMTVSIGEGEARKVAITPSQ